MSDHPFEECANAVNKLLKKGGVKVYQKFTCEGCGQRLTIDDPDKFFTHGDCDKCKTITDIRTKGCNYMLHFHGSFPPSKLTICVTPEEKIT